MRHWSLIKKLVRFILFGSLKNYLNLSGFPVAFISTYQTETPSPFVASSLYRGSCCHKQRVEVFHLNLSIERSWVPFCCWVSLFLTRFTSPSDIVLKPQDCWVYIKQLPIGKQRAPIGIQSPLNLHSKLF